MINIADLIDPKTGKTWRETNLSIKHKLNIGDLVELDGGQRLFIERLTRDCDGTPLYTLAPFIGDDKSLHGYSEDILKLIPGALVTLTGD